MCWCNREMCDHGNEPFDEFREREIERQKMIEKSWGISCSIQEEVFRMLWLGSNSTLAHNIKQMPVLPNSTERLVACGNEFANLMRNGKISEHLALWILEYFVKRNSEYSAQELLYGKTNEQCNIDSLEKVEDFEEYFKGWTVGWTEFWKKFGFAIEPNKIPIPPTSKTHALTIVIPKGMTINIAMKIVNDIGIHVNNKIGNFKTTMSTKKSISCAYSIRVRGGLYSPYTHAYENISTKGLNMTNEDCMNLLEYLVLIARRHVEKNRKNESYDSLDDGAHMLCAGSRIDQWVPKIVLERGCEMYLSLVPQWFRQEGMGAYSVIRHKQNNEKGENYVLV